MNERTDDNLKNEALANEADNGLKGNNNDLKGTKEGYDSSRPEKYLELEQPGVSYTGDSDSAVLNSDNIEDGTAGNTGLWDSDAKNSRNADAFNQDEIILDDNIDLDEDQSESISSDNK